MLSRDMRSYFGTTMFAVATIAALGYINWRLWLFTPDASPISTPAAAGEGKARGTGADSGLFPSPASLAQLSQTTSRPLFFANRRPPDKTQPATAVKSAVAPQAAPAGPLDQFQLVGIMRIGQKNRRALIRTAADGQGVWIGVGEHIRGWQVKEIGDDRAVFEANGQRGQIQLYVASTAKER